jgi:regulator of protease activity HflC (stomatin/prohibitin superfamily)
MVRLQMGSSGRWYLFILIVAASIAQMSCVRVPAGHRGIKVYLLGNSQGVNEEELGVGRYGYWPITQEIHVFPVFQQNVVWARNGEVDQSITFQTREGVSVNGDFGISYSIQKDKVPTLFKKYRRGIEEITDLFLRNMVRDALTMVASKHDIEYVYGEGRVDVLLRVEKIVQEQVKKDGLIIERIYSIGDYRLPSQVVQAINSKIEASQRAQQRENEVREAKAQANKQLVLSRARAKSSRIEAEGDADATRIRAEAEADANRKRAESLDKKVIQYEAVKRWDGRLPTVTQGDGRVPFLNIEVETEEGDMTRAPRRESKDGSTASAGGR